MQIIYEPHPVTRERKAELRALGFKIIDAAFKPADLPADAEALPDVVSEEIQTAETQVQAKRRGRPPKA